MSTKNGRLKLVETDIQQNVAEEVLASSTHVQTQITNMEGEPLFLIESGQVVTAAQLEQINQKPPTVVGKPFTVARACVEALLTTFKDEEVSGDEKLDRYILAMRLRESHKANLDLTADEISKLKTLVGKAYGPMVTGQVWLALDPGLKARKLK